MPASPAQSPLGDTNNKLLMNLVTSIFQLTLKKESGELAPSQLQRLEREIAATDAKIDDFVFELYGITDDERKTIEGSGP